MAQRRVKTIIEHRVDTAANWAAINPIPKLYQLCFEVDSLPITAETIIRQKLGDGATNYIDLPYIAGDGGAVASVNGETGVVVLTAADVGTAATSHPHGNLTNAGAIGATTGLPVFTGALGVIEAVTAVAARNNLGLGTNRQHCVYVSTRSGSTDSRNALSLSVYDATVPFATLQAALTASVAGDRIIVEPGSHPVTSALINFSGRVIELMPGAIIAGAVDGGAVIAAAGGETLTITGYGDVINTGMASVINTASGSLSYIRARRIAQMNSGGSSGIVSGSDEAYIDVDRISAVFYDAVIYTGGYSHIRAREISAGQSAFSVETHGVSDGFLYIEADRMVGNVDTPVLVEDASLPCSVYIRCKRLEALDGTVTDVPMGAACTWWIDTEEIVGDLLHTPGPNVHIRDMSGAGSVTSVAMTVPTGLSVAGSPITSSGTLAVTHTAGYQSFTTVESSKLAGIETAADVTDAANVDAAGAVMNSDISANGIVARTASGTYAARTITAGTGIDVTNGAGTSANPTVALTAAAADAISEIATKASATTQIIAGNGLTGGGTLASDRTINVGAGTGITVNADDVALQTSHVRNVDHSAVSIVSGNGLTGGGTIDATRTLAVGAGTGIAVNADDVALSATTITSLGKADTALQPAAIGTTVASQTDWRLSLSDAAATLNQTINIPNTTPVDIVSVTKTVAAGDIWEIVAWGTLNNNSGSVCAYTTTLSMGALTGSEPIAPGGIASSATDHTVIEFTFRVTVQSSASARLWGFNRGTLSVAAGAGNWLSEVRSHGTWNTSAGDFTGSQTFKIQVHSNTSAGSQNLHLHGYYCRKINAP